MILGVGIDLINSERFIKFENNERFINRILSKEEIKKFKELKNKHINFLSKKFCVKEAFSKAIGTGIGRGINFNDISVLNNILGKPIICLNDKAINFLEELYKLSYDKIQIDLSITDEQNFINSIVIISKK